MRGQVFGLRLLSLLALVAGGSVLAAQRFGGGCNGCEALDAPPNPPYDGRFTYARVKFSMGGGEFGGRFRDVKWGHDYPDADTHFPLIVKEVTATQVRTDGSVIMALDDPELMKYPFAYLCEVGFWIPNQAEAAGLRNYLLKGGFLLVDDFGGGHMLNFEEQMRKVLPEARLIPMTADHPLYDSFYRINAIEYFGAGNLDSGPAQFLGIFEDNDPKKRLMAIVNYNFDVGELWEYSDTGLFPIDLTNEGYKLGVNYLMYSLTH
jgi:hypothetical protein